MANLFEQLNQLFFNNRESWDYYDLIDIPNPFSSPENRNSKEFIKEFLDYSEKTKDIYDALDLIDSDRNLHIVTDYFLGILIYKSNAKVRSCIIRQIEKWTSSTTRSNVESEFQYWWFLICFYHDVGYYYENTGNGINSLATLKSDLNIENRIPKLIGVPKLFHDVKKKYLLYRFNEFNCYDHGILGGMLLYDRLIKIYKYYQNNFHDGKRTFCHNNLYWSDSMFKCWQLIASVVTTHNIWFKKANESAADVDLYKSYRLDKLIIADSAPPITLERHPLLFLLGLVDSIEPTKRYGINFLNKIQIEFSGDDLILSFLGHENDKQIKKWLKNISSLRDWIGIKINNHHKSYMNIIL